ncbi:MAG: hypothetical protein HC880_13255 [Bacteroidia bacterium]|nr:hypothetical protein [Bacteroidia bacterium]
MKHKLLIGVLLALLLIFPGCKDQLPTSPAELGGLYWESLTQQNFGIIRPYWVSIRELNKLMEVVPDLEARLDMKKGAVYSEKFLIQAEKEAFRQIIQYASAKKIQMNKAEYQHFKYATWMRRQGVEVGRVSMETNFRSKVMKIKLLVVYSHNRWRYLGLFSYQVEQTGTPDPSEKVHTI